ncbi:glycoside hydrolase family 5 protein [Burkholderiaceae bacterium UC74_6]
MFARIARLSALGVLLLGSGLMPALAQEAAPALKRGVNIVGYDPLWTDGAQARFQPRHMQAIKDGGFDHVRMNLHAFAHMDKDGKLSPAWFKTLDTLVDAGTKAGLQVILDEHNFEDCAKDLAGCRPKLQAFWRQVSLHFKDAPASVVFEILNEPNGQMNDAWNDVLAENLAIIRASNPTRRVVIGPRMWNSMGELDNLKLPAADRNIVVTFHYYTPMEFTHQGASWTPQFTNLSGITWGTAFDRDRLKKDFAQVATWAERNKRPILLGEFGALEKAGSLYRVLWTDAVARTAEAKGFGWSYWQFDSDFVVWDMKKDGWVKTVHGALIPEQMDPSIKASVERATDPAMEFVINTPRVAAWNVYGDKQTTQTVACEAAGKTCLRVDLKQRLANAWDVGAVSPVLADIRKGDELRVLLWARLDTEDPKAQATVPVLVQMGTPPYTSVVSGAATLTSKLAPVMVAGIAAEGYAGGTVNLALQLGQVGQPVVVSAPYVLRNYKEAAK